MDNFMEFIENNNWDEQIPNGHFPRFKDKYALKHQKKRKFLFPICLGVASVAVLFIFIFINYQSNIRDISTNNLVKAAVNNEETTVYKTKIETQINELIALDCKGSTNQKDSVLLDLQEIDLTCKRLQMELENQPNNVQIKQAILTNYQIKSAILEVVLSELKRICS